MAQDIFARIPDHIEQGLDRLLDQYKGKPRLETWLSVYLKQVQIFEDATYDVIIKRLIDSAAGAQLAVIGRIVGEPNKLSLSDDEYRVFIRARVIANRSLGRVIDVLDVLNMISTVPVRFTEQYPASMNLEFAEEPTYNTEVTAEMLRDTKAAGVWLGITVPGGIPGTAPAFQFWPMSVGGSSDPNHAPSSVGDPPGTTGIVSDAVFTPRQKTPV